MFIHRNRVRYADQSGSRPPLPSRSTCSCGTVCQARELILISYHLCPIFLFFLHIWVSGPAYRLEPAFSPRPPNFCYVDNSLPNKTYDEKQRSDLREGPGPPLLPSRSPLVISSDMMQGDQDRATVRVVHVRGKEKVRSLSASNWLSGIYRCVRCFRNPLPLSLSLLPPPASSDPEKKHRKV